MLDELLRAISLLARNLLLVRECFSPSHHTHTHTFLTFPILPAFSTPHTHALAFVVVVFVVVVVSCDNRQKKKKIRRTRDDNVKR